MMQISSWEIINRLTEANKQLSDLIQDILPLLAQYQAVDEEERRCAEIMKTFADKETN